MSDGVFPSNLQMNPGLAKWTVFWSENFRMESGLVKWTEFCMEIMIGGERGVAEGFFFGKFPGEPRLGDADEGLVGD